ncbi:GGDEF domain-containing protein [Argonema antarcticum]|nr:GGDEF domain-containing protein [Argonema antarcticum]MCL1469884.1 GGDEF domain-containing protein [Argonema antarcticum A004/B2]
MPAAYRDVPVQLAICIGIVLTVAASLMVRNWEQWNIANDPIVVSDELVLSITVSIGGALATQTNKLDGETLLAQADANLYKAKQDGRNCLRMS